MEFFFVLTLKYAFPRATWERGTAYLYTLMCYIEQNPPKANMVKDIVAYPYSSYHYFLK